MQNEWRMPDSSPYFLVSFNGEVKTSDTGRMIKAGNNGNGYFHVQVMRKGKRYTRYVHRLVAECFVPNPNGYKEINHIDGNKLNNYVGNLEWVSRESNIQHAFDMGLIPKRIGKDNPNSKAVIQKDKSGNIIKVWDSVADIHREKGYSTNSIICCCNKKPKYHTAYGYLWEYII